MDSARVARLSALLWLLLGTGCGSPATPSPEGPAPQASGGSRPAPERDEGPPLVLTVLGTNDIHGRVRRMPLLAGYVDNVRHARRRDGGVLLVDGGDMWQGTLVSNLGEGKVMVQAFNHLGYDAAAIGNHEFDYGPQGEAATPQHDDHDPRGALKARAVQADFPLLAANLLNAETGEPVAWEGVGGSTLTEVAGVPVGIIGIATEQTPRTTIAANVVGLRIAPLAETIAEQARSLRERGAAVVVVTAHAGGECTELDDPADTSSCDPDQEIFRVARSLPQGLVDVVVGGHTHAGIAHRVNGMAVVEAYSNARAFARVDLHLDRSSFEVERVDIHPPRFLCDASDSDEPCRAGRYAGREVRPDPSMEALLAPALRRAQRMRERPLGVTLATAFPRSTRRESPLGNLLVDLMRDSYPSVDVAIVNAGGIRADLPAGPLTYGELYEVFPFDNRFATVRVSAAHLRRVLERNLRKKHGIVSLSGLAVRAECDDGNLDVEIRRPDGRRVPDEHELEVLVSDFLATGGDGLFADASLEGNVDIQSGPPIRELLVERLQERGGELRVEEFHDPGQPRLGYPGERPIACGVR